MARYKTVTTCAVCGAELNPKQWAVVMVKDASRKPLGNGFRRQFRNAMPQVKVCAACRSKAIAAVRSLEVQHG